MQSITICVAFVIFFAITSCSNDGVKENEAATGHAPSSPALFGEIAHMDSLLFAAFNTRDLEKMMTMFDSSLEFYHDTGGVSDFARNKELLRDLFERNKTSGLRRELVPGSLEVYPVSGYGAIQTGRHRFCHEEKGKQDCGIFKFLHIWQKKNGAWKITRVASYDHN